MKSMRLLRRAVGLAMALLVPCLSQAATYPDHTVTLVVPYSAGGGVDTTARIVGKAMSTYLKQPFIVENRPGPGGTIGASYVARSRPDGYTLLVGGDGPLTLAPLFLKNMPYVPGRDLTSISLLVTIPQILVVKGTGKYSSLGQLLDAAKKTGVTVAGTQGSGQELAVLMLKARTGDQIEFIPYKGTANEVTDLLGGVIDAAFADPSVAGLLRSGQLKALGVTTPERSPANPNIPTLVEQGVENAAYPGFYALSAPAGVPQRVVDTLNAALKHVLAEPDVRRQLMAQGLDPRYTTPSQAKAFVDAQVARAKALLQGVQ